MRSDLVSADRRAEGEEKRRKNKFSGTITSVSSLYTFKRVYTLAIKHSNNTCTFLIKSPGNTEF